MKHLLIFAIIATASLNGEEAIFVRAATFPTSEGVYRVGDWEYRYAVYNPKTRSEGCWGHLYFRGKEVTAPRNVLLQTPVGTFLSFDSLEKDGFAGHGLGEHGWLNTRRDYGMKISAVFKADGSVDTPFHEPIKNLSVSEILNRNGIPPNQSSEPTLSSVTPPAGQESRPR